MTGEIVLFIVNVGFFFFNWWSAERLRRESYSLIDDLEAREARVSGAEIVAALKVAECRGADLDESSTATSSRTTCVSTEKGADT